MLILLFAKRSYDTSWPNFQSKICSIIQNIECLNNFAFNNKRYLNNTLLVIFVDFGNNNLYKTKPKDLKILSTFSRGVYITWSSVFCKNSDKPTYVHFLLESNMKVTFLLSLHIRKADDYKGCHKYVCNVVRFVCVRGTKRCVPMVVWEYHTSSICDISEV